MIIRSSKTSIKFSNRGKRQLLSEIIDSYKDVMKQTIEALWNSDASPKFLDGSFTDRIQTDLSARLVQCACKQASAIVKGTKKKQKQRMFIINKLKQENKLREAERLQSIYDEVNQSKPDLDNVEMELDSRFVKIDFDNPTSFDGWITLTSLGRKLKLQLPFKSHKHLNKMLKAGKLKNGIRLSKKSITFMFEIEEVKNESKNIVGIDIGVKSLFSVSYNEQKSYQSTSNVHGWNMDSILDRMSRRKKGSKGFQRTVEHRKNYINEQLNKLEWNEIKQLNLENIKNLRKGRRTSKKLKHWNYALIFDRLIQKSSLHDVRVNRIPPTYTSQRCGCCGWTRKSNRNGEIFECGRCGFTHNADLNASVNIRLNLEPLGSKIRLSKPNLKGFYWFEVSEEPISPSCPENMKLDECHI
jgi:transposase